MSIFRDMLGAEESLFSNEHALDSEFVPKMLPYREEKQRYIADCIAPLLKGRDGKNLFIYGSPGIGKTAATRWVLRDLEDETDEVFPIYVNCWQKNTTYKILIEICDAIGYHFTQNKKTDELFKVVKGILNNKAAVLAFDEVDKLEDYDFIYMIAEELFKKSMILITNYKEWIVSLDDRIKSRVSPDTLEFEKYSAKETDGILRERIQYAFYDGVWSEEALNKVIETTYQLEDIRQGIYLLREAGRIAEQKAARSIKPEHADQAIEKLKEFTVKKSSELEEGSQFILELVKENPDKRIGDLYKLYREKGGEKTSKTFQRKIEKLEKAKFIETEKTGGGSQGNTTVVKYRKDKDLTSFS